MGVKAHVVDRRGTDYACRRCVFRGPLRDAIAHVVSNQHVVREDKR